MSQPIEADYGSIFGKCPIVSSLIFKSNQIILLTLIVFIFVCLLELNIDALALFK